MFLQAEELLTFGLIQNCQVPLEQAMFKFGKSEKGTLLRDLLFLLVLLHLFKTFSNGGRERLPAELKEICELCRICECDVWSELAAVLK